MQRLFFLVVLLMPVAACRAPEPVPLELRGIAMGTTWSVVVITDRPSGMTQAQVERLIDEQFDLVVRLMSNYQDDSELSRFNALRRGTPFPVSPEIGEVIGHAMEISALTEGALDITVGPLVEAWGFGPVNELVRPPSPAEIEDLLAATGHRHLQFDAGELTLAKLNPELRIDLSAVAKGYAIDLVATALSANGYEDFMVEVGGEIRVRGSNPDGGPWRLAVERPQEVGRALHTVVALHEGSLATSGDYRNYREVNGNRISHIIDPRSGLPISNGLASVSVIDPLCVRADGLSTALLVLGPERGFALALELDLPALFLERDQLGDLRKRATPKFDELTQ